jgi:cytochrome oxidase Cu insertion factor (SCO1/SenC/PrrC family)
MNKGFSHKRDRYLISLFFIPAFLIMILAQACQNQTAPGSGGGSGSAQPQNVRDMIASLNMYAFDKALKAPEFTLTDISGESVSLSQYRGKVVLLSFWATW